MTDRLYETLLHNRFGTWRYPSALGKEKPGRFPDFVFDALPYIDLLLADVGVKRWRKGGGWKEVWGSYGVEDYRGIVGEWVRNREGRERELERVEKEERGRVRNGKVKGL